MTFLEGEILDFSLINRAGQPLPYGLALPTREIARRIASNKRLRHVLVGQGQALTIPKKRVIYDAIYEHEHIEELNFFKCSDLVAIGLHLRRMKNIKVVRFDSVLIRDPDPMTSPHLLVPNRNLQELPLFRGNMGDTAAQAVLQSVRLRCCLRRIDFNISGLTNRGVIALGQALQHRSMLSDVSLVEFDLALKEEAGVILAQGIERNTSMKKLKLLFGRLLAAGCQRVFHGLVVNATLEEVTATIRGENGMEDSEGAAHLVENNTLKKLFLDLWDHHLDVTPIADALVRNEWLETFGLARLDDSGIQCVCDAFERNDLVNHLIFRNCSRITADGIKPICRLLSNSSTCLKGLDFECCQMDDDKVIVLCESAKESESLEYLKLSFIKFWVGIGNRGTSAVANFVSSSQVIKRLHITLGNNIEDDVFAAFATALGNNHSLKELELHGLDNITNEETRALLDVVKLHRTLTKVNMASLTNTSHKDELDFYLERNRGPKRILNSNLPLSLWPLVLERADDCRHVDGRIRAPDMLHYLVKEKCDLFVRRPSSR